MSSTNDTLRNRVETEFPGSEVVVEGTGTALSDFLVTLTKDGKSYKVSTTLTVEDVLKAFHAMVPSPTEEAEEEEEFTDDEFYLPSDEEEHETGEVTITLDNDAYTLTVDEDEEVSY